MSYKNNELDTKLTSLYILIDNGGLLNYNTEKKQTDFGESLKGLLLSVTNNCIQTIDNIFNNTGFILSNIGCFKGNDIYRFYKGFNTIDDVYEKKMSLFRLLNNISEEKYKEIIEKNAVEMGLLTNLSLSYRTGIVEFILNYWEEEYNNNKNLTLINFLKTHYNSKDIDDYEHGLNNITKGSGFDAFMKERYGDTTINNFNEEFKGNKNLTFSQFQKNLQQSGGGNAKITKKSKKSILGKERCIYKIQGDRKEYLRYKGDLITVKDYTKLMKVKAKSKA